jgi:Holliday junction resolvase YEN1
MQWMREHSLGALAAFCEEKFGWGAAEILKRFQTLLWHGSVIRTLRQAALNLDQGAGALLANNHLGLATMGPTANATPQKVPCDGSSTAVSPDRLAEDCGLFCDPGAANTDDDDKHPLLSTILASTNTHPRTDYLHEYRVELDPFHLVWLMQSDICESVESSDFLEVDLPRVDPLSLHRIWVPASMLQCTERRLVNAFEAKQEAKQIWSSHSAVSKRTVPPHASPVKTVTTATNVNFLTPVPLAQQSVPDIIDLTAPDVIDLTTP